MIQISSLSRVHVIIATYAVYNEIELQKYAPVLVYVDEANRIIGQRD